METADVHVKRAATYIKLGKFPEALQDANCAIGIDNKCANAYMRKGAACFELEEFETAKAAFCQGLEISGAGTSAHKKFSSWVAKCEEKIDETTTTTTTKTTTTTTLPPRARRRRRRHTGRIAPSLYLRGLCTHRPAAAAAAIANDRAYGMTSTKQLRMSWLPSAEEADR